VEPSKTHLSALVAIPPKELCEPIQAIRRKYDRHASEWMPHVTLLYPFRPREAFEEALGALAGLGVGAFDATLATFRFFSHYEWSHTIWLDPEPAEAWKKLHGALHARFPDCDDSSKYETGFTPHLSVGQSRTADLAGELQRGWQPLAWRVSEVALIARRGREPFEVVEKVQL
jgi:RNA 2',3'-cyclic 3'-phosphodiesterase